MPQASLLASPDIVSEASSSIPQITRESLGEHILSEIVRCNGAQLPNYREQEILDSFWEQFGPDDGALICRQAFQVHSGFWRGAQITILRFQRSHDEFFAAPLLEEAQAGDR